MIPHEPLRGSTLPPWFYSLTGIERVHAFNQGLLPRPPLSRLLGFRVTHVTAGAVTVVMPASDACLGCNGMLEITPLMMAALAGASYTSLEAGMNIVPLRFTFDPFRPPWPKNGNLLARAHVLNSSKFYVFAVVQIHDPEGRHIGQGSLHSIIKRIEPTPPPPPLTMKPTEEPIYATPDPYLRNFPSSPFLELLENEDGSSLLRKFMNGELSVPVSTLFDCQVNEFSEGRVTFSMPASEWFSIDRGLVSYPVVAALADMSWLTAFFSLHRRGDTAVALDSMTRFIKPIVADGRSIRSESSLSEQSPDLFLSETKIWSADGTLVATHSGSIMRLEAKRRDRRKRVTQRILTTLLFADIVDSTLHAQRLGDEAWHTLLEQYKRLLRREASRHNGIEVDSAGDGFFFRFDSPQYAIQAARAACEMTKPLGILMRTGIHTGECELDANRLSGMAVHIASRLQTSAQPDEILVSSAVMSLTADPALRFIDKGEYLLKGIAEPLHVYAVEH